MRIALDGMGGDRAPGIVVSGAVEALKEVGPDLDIVLVGQEDVLEAELAPLSPPPGRITISPAGQVASMDDSPSHVLRRMPDSSIRRCFDLLKAGEVSAVVSAGNSGATMAVGMVVMGRLADVDRPALAATLPSLKGDTVLIDVGANVDCSPLMLLQFGHMGAAYAQRVLGVADPKVGLLSIGEEGSKGNNAVRSAHEYLKNSGLNFVGNIEGRDIFSGQSDVVVCDGFVGNICLKLSEGLAESTGAYLSKQAAGSPARWIGGVLLRGAMRRFKGLMDYASYGGVPLLGINGVAFICHGRSNPRAIARATAMAAESVRGELVRHLSEGLAENRGRLLGMSETAEDEAEGADEK